MQPCVQAICSGALTLGVPLVLAVRELVVLRRYDGGGSDWREAPQHPPPPPKLPPCLLVPPRTHPVIERQARGRVLEDA